MNEIISLTADVLTMVGAAVSITVEVRRARREALNDARDAGPDDTQE
ncbi:hypothetical protein ACFWWA_26020 [Streptomyces goshikiensis]